MFIDSIPGWLDRCWGVAHTEWSGQEIASLTHDFRWTAFSSYAVHTPQAVGDEL